DGAGIREAFVFAVRLALDRVCEMMRAGLLKPSTPAINSAQELLTQMQQNEGGALALAVRNGLKHIHLSEVSSALPAAAAPGTDTPQETSLASTLLMQVLRENATATSGAGPTSARAITETTPLAPDAMLPSGMIWPPVDGRLVLQRIDTN